MLGVKKVEDKSHPEVRINNQGSQNICATHWIRAILSTGQPWTHFEVNGLLKQLTKTKLVGQRVSNDLLQFIKELFICTIVSVFNSKTTCKEKEASTCREPPTSVFPLVSLITSRINLLDLVPLDKLT